MVARIVLILVLSLHGAAIQAATVRAHVDRNPVAVNQSFVLTFDVQGEPDGEPDFSPLSALFDILNRSQGSQIQITNGRMQRSGQWQLTLMAREVGDYTIPAIGFGKDRSNSLSLVVQAESGDASAQDDALFLEAELVPQQAYVGSQLVYRVRLLRSVSLRSGNLSEPKVSGAGAIIEKLGDDRSFETLRNGVRYVVVERNFAIFPQQAGTLTVEPSVFQGQIAQASRFGFNTDLRARRIVSEAFSVEVKAIPTTAQRPWLPSPDVQLVEEWPQDPPRFRVGEPLTRTLRLTASGISAPQLPALAGALPDGLKQYADQPYVRNQTGADGLTGVRQEKIAIVPSRVGRFELPAIEIPWWNTETGQQEYARIPARGIEVSAAADFQPGPPPLPVPALPAATAPAAEPGGASRAGAGLWPWVSLALVIAWLATALLWWRQRRVRQAEPAPLPRYQPSTPSPEPPKDEFPELRQACQQNDAAACKSALLGLGKTRWPDQPPASLGALATRVDADFAETIDELNRALYGQATVAWDGAALLREAQRWLKSKPVETAAETSPIPPLHPQR